MSITVYRHSTKSYKKVIMLALPLVFANITVPLLGLIDTAILGHMGHTYYLAGASIGSLIFTQIIWICGFLKMSVTGLSAQANNASKGEQFKVLSQACFLGICVGIAIFLVQYPLLEMGLWFANSAPEVAQSTTEYFIIRIWSAPASLINLALVGWFIGRQQTKLVLYLQVFVNLCNIVFSLVYVYIFDMGIQGVALGTVTADYLLLMIGAYWAYKPYLAVSLNWYWLSLKQLKPLVRLNSNILIRNLALQITLAFVTFKGAQFGETTAATNAILMQFFALTALGLDGIANAVEALVGDAKGKRKIDELNHQVSVGLVLSSLCAIVYSMIFALCGEYIIASLTNQAELISNAKGYLWLMIVLPVVAHWCFLFDGVFVGLTQGRAMRNTMILSSLLGFLPSYLLFQSYQNFALWYALLVFLGFRGLLLGASYYRQLTNQSLLKNNG